mgnify:CR=1 FL=1
MIWKMAPVRACTPMTAIPSLSPEMETIVTKDQIRNAIIRLWENKIIYILQLNITFEYETES